MEKSFQKFLKKMLSEEYPNILDVRVVKKGRRPYSNNLDWYDVFLIVKDKNSEEYVMCDKVKRYVKNLSTYMNLSIAEIFVVPFEESWGI